jgi:hypothetical protein
MFLAEKDFLSMKHKKFMMKLIPYPFSRLLYQNLKWFAQAHVHSVNFIHGYRIMLSAPTGKVIPHAFHSMRDEASWHVCSLLDWPISGLCLLSVLVLAFLCQGYQPLQTFRSKILLICVQNLKSERCNVMVCVQSTWWKRMGLVWSFMNAS